MPKTAIIYLYASIINFHLYYNLYYLIINSGIRCYKRKGGAKQGGMLYNYVFAYFFLKKAKLRTKKKVFIRFLEEGAISPPL